MLTKEENELLCRTGPGTPGGDLMRRYWQPVAVEREFPVGSPPMPVRLLGDKVLARKLAEDVGVPVMPATPPLPGDLKSEVSRKDPPFNTPTGSNGEVIKLVSSSRVTIKYLNIRDGRFPLRQSGRSVYRLRQRPKRRFRYLPNSH